MKRLNIAKQWQLNRAIRKADSLLFDVDAFIEKCEAYFAWADKSPWERVELVKHKGDWSEADVPLGRPYSMDELCTYLGVSAGYFRATKKKIADRLADGIALDAQTRAADEDRLAAIEFVETHIRAQQISGATVGVFKEGIIARLNQLAETTANTNTNEAVVKITVRDQATADALRELDDIL